MGSKALERKRAARRSFKVLSAEERSELSERVRYEGSPHHKKEPNDFGLTPPTGPRKDKTLCDEAGILEKAQADILWRRALEVGLVSESTMADELPRHIWVVGDDGRLFEAIYGGSHPGAYHGYPVREADPFFDRGKKAFAAAVDQRTEEETP